MNEESAGTGELSDLKRAALAYVASHHRHQLQREIMSMGLNNEGAVSF